MFLIASGGSVNQVIIDGNTPLHVASIQGHLEVVKVLISNDGSVNEADNDGFTPLHLASGHSEVVKLLVELEGSVNQAGYNDGITLNSISILVL